MFIRQIIGIVRNSKKSFSLLDYTFLVCDLDFTTPCWSATSSLLHLNQFWRGGGASPTCPPLNTPMRMGDRYKKQLSDQVPRVRRDITLSLKNVVLR